MKATKYLKFLTLGLAISALAACGGSGKPVSSGEDSGTVSDAGEDKPTSYTAQEGDTLRKIAGRSEIYGDPDLWPLLQEANADVVGKSQRVNSGVVLSIPRDVSDESQNEAREKARQVAASNKSKPRVEQPRAEPTADVNAVPTKEAKATATSPQPVPKAKKGGMLMPILLILLLVLLAVGGVLYYMSRKDDKEQPQ